MSKLLPIAVVIFTILCLVCTINVAGNSLPSKNDNSPKDPKDSTEIVSPVSSNNPSSGRIILSSAWSKEEKEDLKPNYDKNVENKEQDILLNEKLFDGESSLWNMKKFLRKVMSLLYAVTESDDGFLEKPLNDVVFHMKTLTNNYSRDKSDDNKKTEMKSSDNTDTPDKLADDNQIQNISNADALNKSSDDRKTQNLSKNDSLDNRQPTDNSKTEMQNTKNKNTTDNSERNTKTTTQNLSNSDVLNKSKDDDEVQNSPTNNALDKSSKDGKTQKSSSNNSANNKQPTEIETQNYVNKDSINVSENNMKYETLKLENSDTQSKFPTGADLQDSTPNDTLNKSSSDKKAEKPSNKDPTKNKQQTENPKIETQNDIDQDSIDKSQNNIKSEAQNFENSDTRSKSATDGDVEDLTTNDTLNKPSNDRQSHKSSNNDSTNNRYRDKSDDKSKIQIQNSDNTDTPVQPADDNQIQNPSASGALNKPMENPNIQTQTDMNKDSIDKSQNNMKPEAQNLENSDSRSKSAASQQFQDSTVNDTLNRSSSNDKKENSPENNSFDAMQPTENTKNSQQISTNEDYSNKSKYDINMQKPSNDGIQMQSVPVLKNDKPKEDSARFIIKDYDDCNSSQTTMGDIPTNCTPKNKTNEYEDYDDDKEDGVEDENEEDENDTENDFTNDNIYDNENNVNSNDVGNGVVDENNDVDKTESPSENQNTQSAFNVPEKAHNQSITLPKFIVQAINNQQNYSQSNSLRNEIDNNDNVKPEVIKSQSLTNLEDNSPKFLLSSDEFVDDYINNGQRKIPERKGEQSNNTEELIPNKNDATRKITRVLPIFRNKLEENRRPSNDIPLGIENMNDQNMPFDQSSNAIDKFWPERNPLPSSTPNEEKKYLNPKNPNKDHLYENLPQNVQNTFTSTDKPISFTQGYRKNNDVAAEKNFPLPKIPQFVDLQYTFNSPQEDHNSYAKPATFDFQSARPSDKAFHSDTPNINGYKPEEISPFHPKNPIPLQNENNLNNQYLNSNFPYEEIPGLNTKRNQQVEQSHPTILQPDKFSSIQYISKPNTPGIPEKTTHFANYKPERPMNIPNMEMLPNYLTSDVLQFNTSVNQIYKQDTSPTDIEKSMDKTISQDQLRETKPQNQNINTQTLNLQSQLDSLSFQDKFSGQQMLFPQNDAKKSSLPREINNETLPIEINMNSEILPTQDKSKNAEIPLSQNGPNNSSRVPHRSFNFIENNLQNKSKNQDSSSVISENIADETISEQTKASSRKPLIDETEKRKTLDESERQKQISSNFNPDSNNEDSGESPSDDYESENEKEESGDSERSFDEDEIEDDYIREDDEDDDGEDIMDEDEDENQDDYTRENNEDYEDNPNEKEDKDQDDYINENNYDYEDYQNEDEDEDDGNYKNENNYDENKTGNNNQNEQTAINGYEILDSSVTPPNFVNQAMPYQQNYSLTQPLRSQINTNSNIISEGIKSPNTTNKENLALGFESFSSGYVNDSHLEENPKKENKPFSLSDRTVNDAYLQVTPKPAFDNANDAGGSSEISKTQNESASSNQGETFDTILEYIYKFSNNSFFKGIKDQKNDK